MRNTGLLISILAVGVVTVTGYSTSVAQGVKVMTVEKAGGPEVVVGDAVAAKLQAGTKAEFPTSVGEITCGKSEFKGAVESNPEKGAGNALVKNKPLHIRRMYNKHCWNHGKGRCNRRTPAFRRK